MSLLRQRAIAVSFESTFNDFRPADARAWLVRLTSFDSDAELNVLGSHAAAWRGLAIRPIEVRTNATRTIATARRGAPGTVAGSLARDGRTAVDSLIGGLVSCGHREGSPV